VLYIKVLATIAVAVVVWVAYNLGSRLRGSWTIPGAAGVDTEKKVTCEVTCGDDSSYSAMCNQSDAYTCNAQLWVLCEDAGVGEDVDDAQGSK